MYLLGPTLEEKAPPNGKMVASDQYKALILLRWSIL
jgi:hypothetical protein